MTRLANALRSQSKDLNNFTRTENGALTYKSSLSAVLDLFANGGAFKTRSEKEIADAVEKAFQEDALLALRCLFYLRDARGGQGQRRTFRVGLNHLAKTNPARLRANLRHIPFFGRWDDVFALVGTELENEALGLVAEQFRSDLKNDQPSILGKWMPSENASSKTTISLAKKLIAFLGMKPRNYRKALSSLRKKINVVERLMCSKNWNEINFQGVPSYAALRYRKAFGKHDNERYVAYLNAVKKGEAKINASVLYPYDLVHKAWYGQHDATVEAQWNALPNYMEKPANALVIADVSGSMSGMPMEVCISLALYIAEKNKGPFHNMFMSFSATSDIQEVKGNTLRDKIHNLSQDHWGMNTNLQAAFDNILAVALKNKLTQDDMVETLIIVSDMEFDQCVSGLTNFKTAEKKFNNAGYKFPDVVFWQVDSRNTQVPTTMHQSGALLVSGYSPSILSNVLNKKNTTPYELMVDKLNSQRYQIIQ